MGGKQGTIIIGTLFAVAFVFACVGINWDLPSETRAQRVLAPQWDKKIFFDDLAGGWENIYARAAGSTPLSAEADGKYSTRLKGGFQTDFKTALPVPELWNSYRSMLIRSRYPDEALPLSDLARMKPAELDFRPPSFLYGGAYLYPLGAYYLALSRLKVVHPLPLRAALERTDTLGGVYLAGRILSAAAFAATCLMVFLIAWRLEPGLAAYAAFFAALTMPVLTLHAKYLTPHLWAAFWGLSAIFLTILSLPEFKLKTMSAAAVCLGLAAGSYWGASHTLIFILAVLASAGKDALKPEALKRVGIAALIAAGIFLLFNPYVPFNWPEVVRELRYGGTPLGPLPETRPYLLFTKIFSTTIGPAFALLFPAGCIWGVFSGRRLLSVLSAAILLFAFPASSTLSAEFLTGIRRFFPWLLLGVIMASVFLARLTSKLNPAFRALIVILALAPGAVMSVSYAKGFVDSGGKTSTYRRMADKLDSMPAGRAIGMLDFPQPSNMPAFRLDRWRLRLYEAQSLRALNRKELPEYLLVNYNLKAGLSDLLSENYTLDTGFYPSEFLGVSPDPFLCAANPPVELYRLKQAAKQ